MQDRSTARGTLRPDRTLSVDSVSLTGYEYEGRADQNSAPQDRADRWVFTNDGLLSFDLQLPSTGAHVTAAPSKPGRSIMTAFNAVRFRVKPGREQQFLDAHNRVGTDWPGLQKANIIKTGEQTYCMIAEWTSTEALANARANMIATLNSFRDTLEDLGGGVGVTDAVSGPVVLALK